MVRETTRRTIRELRAAMKASWFPPPITVGSLSALARRAPGEDPRHACYAGKQQIAGLDIAVRLTPTVWSKVALYTDDRKRIEIYPPGRRPPPGPAHADESPDSILYASLHSFMRLNIDYFTSLLHSPNSPESFTIHGVWAGGRMQGNHASDQVVVPHFFVTQFWIHKPHCVLIQDPECIKMMLESTSGLSSERICVVPYIQDSNGGSVERLDIDFDCSESLAQAERQADEMIDRVEAKDPFIEKQFGKIGAGVGDVLFIPNEPVVLTPDDCRRQLWRRRRIMSSAPSMWDYVAQLSTPSEMEHLRWTVHSHTKDAALRQAVADACNGEFDQKLTRPLYLHVFEKISVETKHWHNDKASKLRALNKLISKMIAEWYLPFCHSVKPPSVKHDDRTGVDHNSKAAYRLSN